MKNSIYLKMTSIIICFTMIFGGVSVVFADVSGINMDITSGAVENLYHVQVTVQPPIDGVLITFLVTNEGGAINYIKQESTNLDGKAVFSYINKGADGTYHAAAKRSDTGEKVEKSYIVSGESSASFINEFNQKLALKDTIEVAKLLYQAVALFDVNIDIYGVQVPAESMKTIAEFCVKELSGTPINKPAELVNSFYEAQIVERLNHKTDALNEILANSTLLAKLNIGEICPKVGEKTIYEASTAEIKGKIHTAVAAKNNYMNLADVQNEFVMQTLLKNIGFSEWKEFYGLLKSYSKAKLITVNWSEYEGLSTAKQNTVMQKLIGKPYNDYKALEYGFNEFVSSAVNTGGGSSGGGGGGSSGGGGSNVQVTVPKTENTNSSNIPVPELPTKKNVFSDMDDTKWAIKATEYLYEIGVVKGRNENCFEPNEYVTREEFVKMVVEIVQPPKTNITLPFCDVSEYDWSYDYIKNAYASGIISGKSEDFFDKTANVTREEAAVIMHRTIMKFEKNPPDIGFNKFITFDDIDAAEDWAKEEINYLLRIGIISGKALANYMPKDNMTRAEAANMLYTYLTKLGKVEGVQ